MSETKFNPCKNCGGLEYNLFDLKSEDAARLKLGKIKEVTPETCDKCNLEIMQPETDTLQ